MEPEHDGGDGHGAPQPPSRSARKRVHRALQALAGALLRATPGELARIPLPDPVREAVEAGRAMRRGARARQVRHLANLLERGEVAPIEQALEQLRGAGAHESARLHRLERWRERLIEEGDGVLGELAERFPDLDRQRLRALAREAREERAHQRAPRRFRELLRYLRELEEAGG